MERLEQVVLSGEPPDPASVPPGCRFHPRCPVVASGEAARLGIEARCRGTQLPVLVVDTEHTAACHALP